MSELHDVDRRLAVLELDPDRAGAIGCCLTMSGSLGTPQPRCECASTGGRHLFWQPGGVVQYACLRPGKNVPELPYGLPTKPPVILFRTDFRGGYKLGGDRLQIEEQNDAPYKSDADRSRQPTP